MPETDIIQQILQDSKYNLSIFSNNEIQALQNLIFSKQVRGKESLFVNCIIREKDIQLKPEEVVRQKSEKLSFWN